MTSLETLNKKKRFNISYLNTIVNQIVPNNNGNSYEFKSVTLREVSEINFTVNHKIFANTANLRIQFIIVCTSNFTHTKLQEKI